MPRDALVLFASLLAIALFATLRGVVAEEGSPGAKRPLDLPVGNYGEVAVEDVPEIVSFWGSELEGDGFFWCFPAYIFCGNTLAFEGIKDQVAAAVNQLGRRTKFTLVAYNYDTIVWRRTAQFATKVNKAEPSRG